MSLHMVDVTEPVELQERLQAERDYTRAVIDSASSMIVLTRRDGTVIAANPATTLLTGFTEEELVDGRCGSAAHREGPSARPPRLSSGDENLPPTGEAQLQTKARRPPAVAFSADMHRASADAPVTLVISATDVTAARQNAGMVDHLLRSARTIAFVGTDLARADHAVQHRRRAHARHRRGQRDRTGARGVHRSRRTSARNVAPARGQAVFEAMVDACGR